MKRLTFYIIAILALGTMLSCSEKATQERVIISSTDDLHGKDIAVLGGSVQDLLLSQSYPDNNILRSESDSDILTMVNTGKVDASVTSGLSWMMAEKSYPNIVAVQENINPIPIAFAFSKSRNDLLDKFNAFLADFLANEDINKIMDEWEDPESNKQMPSPDQISGKNGIIHFASSAITPPFNYIKNGEVSGLEPEILARFAISLDMKWDFANVAFSGLIAYIQSGKADIAASLMCITPERLQSVNFSDPYMEEGSVVIVNRENAPEEFRSNMEEERKPFFERIKDSLFKSLIKEDRYKMILDGLGTTILISLLAAIFGTILGMLLCFASMRRNRFISGATNVFIEFMRCMPQVVFLMIMFYVVFGKSDIDGSWVAVIAFSLCFAAYTSVIFRTSVQSIDKGQNEAALSMGFSKIKAFINIILPQTVQRALPVYKGEFIGLVKATSIVGYIAVFDLTKAGDIIRSRTYEALFPLILITIMYFIVIWALTIALKFIETRTQPKRKKFFK